MPVGTAFFFSLAGNISVLIVLAVCLVILFGMLGWMLKD